MDILVVTNVFRVIGMIYIVDSGCSYARLIVYLALVLVHIVGSPDNSLIYFSAFSRACGIC